MKYLCENIQGCIIGYTQSDEITLILTDYETFTTDAWFEYEVQKLCSISASMATKEFNRIFQENVNEFIDENKDEINNNPERKRLYDAYMKAIEKGAMFDSRCFNIPKEEVTNLIYWRQQEASRNSIQMVGRANFSHRQLQNKSCNDICNMLMIEKGIDWENFKVYQKRGSCCIKRTEIKMIDTEEVTRSKWVIDKEIPVFNGDDRAYIDELI